MKVAIASRDFIFSPQLSHKISETLVFHFFQRKKIGFGKSDFVRFCFAKSKKRVRNAPRHQWKCVQMLCRDRRMDRGARSGVNQGEAEGPVSAEAPPWQGIIIKFNNDHSQGMSKAQAAECRRARSPENRLQPPSAKHERRGGSPAAAGRFFGEKAPPLVVLMG